MMFRITTACFALIVNSMANAQGSNSIGMSSSAEVYRPNATSPVSIESNREPISAPRTAIASDMPSNMPSNSSSLPPPGSGAERMRSGGSPFTSMTGSLALVLGAFGVFVWFFRKTGNQRARGLTAGVFEVLGRSQLAARQQAMLVRCGERVLLLNLGPHGATTLAEFTDAAEIQRLIHSCQSREASAFQESLQQLGRQPASGGFATTGNLFG